jgi:hypothetical protein
VVVLVRLLRVLGFFLLLRVIVAVDERVVVVFVRVPVLAVFPRVERVVRMMVRDVVMIVRVSPGGVGMLRLFTLALGVLSPLAGMRLHIAFLHSMGSSGRSRATDACHVRTDRETATVGAGPGCPARREAPRPLATTTTASFSTLTYRLSALVGRFRSDVACFRTA